jgi:hypothetical protein
LVNLWRGGASSIRSQPRDSRVTKIQDTYARYRSSGEWEHDLKSEIITTQKVHHSWENKGVYIVDESYVSIDIPSRGASS